MTLVQIALTWVGLSFGLAGVRIVAVYCRSAFATPKLRRARIARRLNWPGP